MLPSIMMTQSTKVRPHYNAGGTWLHVSPCPIVTIRPAAGVIVMPVSGGCRVLARPAGGWRLMAALVALLTLRQDQAYTIRGFTEKKILFLVPYSQEPRFRKSS